MSRPERHAETGRWMDYAGEDLIAAERMLQDKAFAPRQACFLAQQAAEKALKAGLVFLGIEFPKTHDLGRLRLMFPGDWNLGQGCSHLAGLTQWAVEPRYPSELPPATPDDAAKAVGQAKLVLDAIEHELTRHDWGDNSDPATT